MYYLKEGGQVSMHAEECDLATGREGAWEPEADEREQWERTHLFQKQFTQPVTFSILLAITEAEKEIWCWRRTFFISLSAKPPADSLCPEPFFSSHDLWQLRQWPQGLVPGQWRWTEDPCACSRWVPIPLYLKARARAKAGHPHKAVLQVP